MDKPQRSGPDFNDAGLFNPDVYLREVYPYPEPGAAPEGQRTDVATELFSLLNVKTLDTFTSGDIKGERFLDFGCGPSLHIAIAANCAFSEIYVCEYADQNRQAVQDWIDKKPTAHDWTSYLKYATRRQAKGATWQEFEAAFRQSLKGVFPCDVFNENFFEPHHFEANSFDCITSSLCLEACCRTEDEYKNVVKRLSNYLKPGGSLVMEGVLEQTYWSTGDQVFYSLPLNSQLLESALSEAGFEDIKLEKFDEDLVEIGCDAKGLFLIRGVKKV